MVKKHHPIEPKRIVHLAEGKFSLRYSKMTTGVIRYGIHHSVAVIDSTHAGKTSQDVIHAGGDIPVVSSLAEAMKLKPEVMLIGITPPGGQIPDSMRPVILEAIRNGLDVWAGLHDFMDEDPEIAAAAAKHNVKLWDIRKPGKKLPVGGGLCRYAKSYISLMVGTDCALGKMTVALEIDRAAKKQGAHTEFVATGQCGIAIAGWGSPIDAIPGDFMAGCVERDCMAVDGADMILVEGQGALMHPGFSSVTLALLHGSCPDSVILCHQVSRKEISNIKEVPIPSLMTVLEGYLKLAEPIKRTHLVGVALNTTGLNDHEAKAAIAAAERECGVPCTDVVRYGAEPLYEALGRHRKFIGK